MHKPHTDTILTDADLLLLFNESGTREQAFTALVRRYQERLYWHIRRMVVRHEDTDDILQLVFIKMWQGLDNFRNESGLFTWLYRIATNETLNWLSQQKKRTHLSLSDYEVGLSETVAAEPGFDANKLEWRLQQAIQELPEKQRLVFTLRYYDEMPYEQMSEILETSIGALKASYHHAVKKVEKYISKH